MALRNIRKALWVLVAVVALGAGAGAILLRPQASTTADSSFGRGEFTLVDAQGNAVDQTVLAGHPSMLFFGFTHCPEVCPTTMGEMAGWFDALGGEADDLRAYFVTVDPERDTPEVLGEYVSWVSDRIIGLTGAPEEIAKAARSWGVFYEKVPLEGGDYTMDHTASVFLVDDKGEFAGTIAYREDSQTAVGKLRNLLAGS
jgi:protein SCO1/2